MHPPPSSAQEMARDPKAEMEPTSAQKGKGWGRRLGAGDGGLQDASQHGSL